MGAGAWRSCPGSRPGRRRRPGPRSRAWRSGPGKDGGQDLVKRVGLHQGLDLGGDIGPQGVQSDELPGQVRQHRCGGVGAGDHHGLAFQGRDDLGGPDGVTPTPVLREPGVNPCLTRALQLGRGGLGGDDLQDGVVLQPRPHHRLQGGVDLGVQTPDPVSGLVPGGPGPGRNQSACSVLRRPRPRC